MEESWFIYGWKTATAIHLPKTEGGPEQEIEDAGWKPYRIVNEWIEWAGDTEWGPLSHLVVWEKEDCFIVMLPHTDHPDFRYCARFEDLVDLLDRVSRLKLMFMDIAEKQRMIVEREKAEL